MKIWEYIKTYSSQDLAERKNWYSPAAEAYNKVRPRYPQTIIDRAISLAQLSPKAHLLEVGCGPATATVSFAPLGYEITSLEPNPDFYQIAQHNCRSYSNVNIINTSFEEWELEAGKFDLVFAATSFHWIPVEIAYPKAANALKNNGFLLLLWNVISEPSQAIYDITQDIYQTYAPDLLPNTATPEENLNGLGEMLLNSSYFTNLVSENRFQELTYSVDNYVLLLSTLSPYLKIEPEQREGLFLGLKARLRQHLGEKISFSYLSAFHLAQKKSQ